MLRRACAVVSIIVTLAGSVSQKAKAGSPQGQLLLPILEILHDASVSGSLEFTRPCDEMSVRNFPSSFHLSQSSNFSQGTAVQRLREIFKEDSAVRIEQDSSRRIRVIEQGIPTDLLNLRIRRLSFMGVFSAAGVYTPNDALYVILNTPEVIAFSKAHEIQILGFNNGIGAGNGRPLDSPHISGFLEGVTVAEALDEVLKTFPGIWVYQNCPATTEHQRIDFFRFFYLRDIGAGAFVEG